MKSIKLTATDIIAITISLLAAGLIVCILTANPKYPMPTTIDTLKAHIGQIVYLKGQGDRQYIIVDIQWHNEPVVNLSKRFVILPVNSKSDSTITVQKEVLSEQPWPIKLETTDETTDSKN